MSSFDTMSKALEPLRIYSITEGNNLWCELMAYAEGLDMLNLELDTILRESFCATAESYGLTERERLWGAVRDDLPTEKRREMLIERNAFGVWDFTPEGVEKILRMLGIEGVLQEYPSVMRMVLIVATSCTKGQKNWIRSQLAELLPAHLELDAVFTDFSWKDIDAAGLSFAEMEAASMTWKEIDIYCK